MNVMQLESFVQLSLYTTQRLHCKDDLVFLSSFLKILSKLLFLNLYSHKNLVKSHVQSRFSEKSWFYELLF